MANFMPYMTINVEFTAASATGNLSKNVLLIGQRNTSGELSLTQNGFMQPNYYIPFLLPNFPDGKSALAYLKNYGINSKMGIDFSLTFPAPDSLITSAGVTTLVWDTVPPNFSDLLQFVLTGVVSQGAINATVRNAMISAGKANLNVNGTPAFVLSGDTGGNVTLTGVNNINYPDPNATDPIALMVWDFYETALSAFSSPNGSPQAYISILSDRDNSITPSSTAIALPAPDAVTVNADDTVTLSFNYTDLSDLTGFGYLPTTVFGDTSLTQATSNATGTFQGFTVTPESSGGVAKITLSDVTGTFNTTDVLSVVLDNTVSLYDYLNTIQLYAAVQQFPINTLNDINVTHKDFFDLIAKINLPSEVLNNHFGTYAMAGNLTILPSQAATLPNANDPYKILISYPYVYKFGDVPYENTDNNVAGGRIASAVSYMLSNGDAPFPPLMLTTINHLPVSSSSNLTKYSSAPNGTGNIAAEQGWIPLAPNNSNQVQLLQSITSLTTIPNTNVEDIEFRYTHVWDCIRYIKFQVAQLYKRISVLPNNQGSALLSNNFITSFREGIKSILFVAESLNIVQNVAAYQNQVIVRTDAAVPSQVDAYIPSQIIPQLNGANIMVNVFSALYQFQTNQGAA